MSPNTSQRLIIIALLSVLFALIIAGLIWLAQHVEWVTEEKEVGYQGEARYNTLLAASRLLKRMQLEVKTTQRLPQIERSLQHNDVLLLIQSYRPLSEAHSKKVLEWIKGGGHLILVSNTLHNLDDYQEDSLLDALHVLQFSLELDDADILDAPPAQIQLPNHKSPFAVDFHPDYSFFQDEDQPEIPTDFYAESEFGVHLLHANYGAGHMTLLTDAWFLHNARIGEQDHAAFLWALITLEGRPKRAWLVYPLSKGLVDAEGIRRKPTQQSYCEDCATGESLEGGVPSLWTLLWQHAWFLLLSLLLTVLLALWLATRRFGGLLPEPPQQRRSLLEHIDASGEFLWQAGQANQLLRGLRQSVFNDVQHQHPHWLDLSHEALSKCLAEHCALAPDRVQSALYHVQFSSTAAFLDAVQCLKHIRRTL